MKSPENIYFNHHRKAQPVESGPEDTLEIEDAMLEFLISQSYYINAGNNGVIHAVSGEHIPSLIKESEELGKDRKTLALKMLKIYEAGVGEAEFAMQKKAYDLIMQQEDRHGYAQIPKPIFCKSVRIASETVRQQLKGEGIASPEKVSLICMDYIDGEDFAMHLYKKIIMRAEKISAQDLAHMSFVELQSRVAHILDFHVAKQRNNPAAEEMVARDNAKKIIPFLKRSQNQSTSLRPEFVEKIRKTINVLHKNGIHHRDLHERNIMLPYNAQTGLCDEEYPYIIDFGASIEVGADVSAEDIYTQDEHRLVDDLMVVTAYKDLTLSKTDEKKKRIATIEDTCNRIQKRLEKQEAWKSFTEKVMSDSIALLDIERLLMGVGGSSLEIQFYIRLIALREIEKTSPEKAMALYDEVLQSVEQQPFFYNLARDAQSIIFSQKF